MNLNGLPYLIVGAGFFGAVMAERIANDLGQRVLVIDKRDHIGGNSYSALDPMTGIECHCYGSHIFHTSNRNVWEYISHFTGFNSYRHKVLTRYQGRTFIMPINLSTINSLYNLDLSPEEAARFIKEEAAREGIAAPANLEEKAISLIGRPLYEAFIRGYTIKQWQTDPRDLPESIITRLPVRCGHHYDYFDDRWQGIPWDGYGALFERMVTHPLIEVRLQTDYFAIRDQVPEACKVIYTGPIDRFFDYRYGVLGWRTLRFELEVVQTGDFQGTTVVNYADSETPYTRIHEFRHYHPERTGYPTDRSVIYREYSLSCGREDDPYYPINTAQDREKYELYRRDGELLPNVLFGARLGTYRYLDMDKVIEQALELYENRVKARL
ncbi:UDP-galactopyranose mutase [Trichlorobacter ammonificans]|uniref:UDP-galactopyranose mutase n=1 Tax=Trichlorobacter ammonificans TaxID=2916410 RepID=A0ABM9D500_9BACT|nr:UDP-galactopyranose mutase [Trichlorobacter ammonificans]CAH2029925.1 UDP-galactopyranose mutase [Trichlorobacter ammonificans]